ncbi:hypothetical protein ED236_04780 [Pseudomethylobacillus aquaticus]|uniref:Phospholipase D-like domain-containing protein n=2 Tax=Pseudomethylobacillus aquaticus TaxID=2676064 RepID=A0A3N0V398_9PROT|nr:hypothetical protein ED236_04780 [Pseudomethylobacillus aquaticus]
MAFVFQQPGTAKLLHAIDNAAVNADKGGGVFAFASKGGIDALFDSPNIANMLAAGRHFHLIVGIDAITNAEALLCLSERVASYPALLAVNVFFHNHPNSTFHPKFSWFWQGNNLRLVTGSGNLTRRGLGQVSMDTPPPGNWEAFSVQNLSGADAEAAQLEIDNWLSAQQETGRLLSLDDEKVREQAMANGRVRFSSTIAAAPPAPAAGVPAPAAPAIHATLVDGVDLGTPEVLVREIPVNRTGQADVGKSALMEFFGYEGVAKNVFVQHVSRDDVLGPVESIRLFVNQSQNYRLELHAIADLEYKVGADDSRMILVATKLDRRSFRYTIVPVTSADYTFVSELLGPIPPHGHRRLMRERRILPENLRAAWPDAPPNLLPVELLTPEP